MKIFCTYKKHQSAQRTQKSTKSTKKYHKTQKRNQVKAQNVNKRRKIKNALKRHLSGKK